MAEHNFYLYQPPPQPQPTAPPLPSSLPTTTATTTNQQHSQQHSQLYPQQHSQQYPQPQPQYHLNHTPATDPITSPSPSPPPLTTPNDAPSSTDEFEKEEYRKLHTEKAVTTLSAGLLSTLVICLSYVAVFASSDIYRSTIAPLASTSVLIVAAIISALYLVAVPGVSSKFAVLPIFFAVIAGSMVIILNASLKATSDGGFVKLNRLGVLLSAGVFGGLGLGTTLGFLLFASRHDFQFPI